MDDANAPKPSAVDRRDFLKIGGGLTAGLLARGVADAAAREMPPLPENPATPEAMPTRNLGRTGVVYRALREPSPLTEIALAWRTGDERPALARFLEAVRSVARQ